MTSLIAIALLLAGIARRGKEGSIGSSPEERSAEGVRRRDHWNLGIRGGVMTIG
jgi:hypothetical protein